MKLHLPLGLLSALLVSLAAVVPHTEAAGGFSTATKTLKTKVNIPDEAWVPIESTHDPFYSDPSDPEKTNAWIVDLTDPKLNAEIIGRNFRITFHARINGTTAGSNWVEFLAGFVRHATGFWDPDKGEYILSNSTWSPTTSTIPAQGDNFFNTTVFRVGLRKRLAVVNHHNGSNYVNDDMKTGTYFVSADGTGNLAFGQTKQGTDVTLVNSNQYGNNGWAERVQVLLIAFVDAKGTPKYTTFTIENQNAGYRQQHVYAWAGLDSNVIGSNTRDMWKTWGLNSSLALSDTVDVAIHSGQPHQTYNLQEELFSNIAVRNNNERRKINNTFDGVNDPIEDEITNGTYNMIRFMSEGSHKAAYDPNGNSNGLSDEEPEDDYPVFKVGGAVALKTSQAMGYETLLGGVTVDVDADGYSFSSGFNAKRDESGKLLTTEELAEREANGELTKTLKLGSNAGGSTAVGFDQVNFYINGTFSLGTANNPWEDIKLEQAIENIYVNVASKKTFSIYGKTKDEPLEFRFLNLEGGGTFSLSKDIAMTFTYLDVGEGSTFDMNHSSLLTVVPEAGKEEPGRITLYNGSLKNAENFQYTVRVDANEEAVTNKSIFSAGKVAAEHIELVSAPHSLRDIGAGTITVSGPLTFRMAADNFTVKPTGSGVYLLHFADPSKGYVKIAADAKVTMDIDLRTVPGWSEDWTDASGAEKGHLDEIPYEGQLYLWLTNGTVLNDAGATLDVSNYDEVNQWFNNHFLVPSFLRDLEVYPSYSVGGYSTGQFLITISTNGVWYSGRQGEYINSLHILDETYDNERLEEAGLLKWSSVVVNTSLTLDLTPTETDNNITLRFLSSLGKDGALTIIRNGDEPLKVTLSNEEGKFTKSGKEISPDTVFSKNIIVKDELANTVLEKVGTGKLTVNGDLKGKGKISVMEGTMVLNGMESEADSIEALDAQSSHGDLVVNGVLTLTGETDLAKTTGAVEMGTLGGTGTLVLKNVFRVNAPRLDTSNGLAVVLDDADNAVLSLLGGDVQLGGLAGEGTLRMEDASRLTISGGRDYVFKGKFDTPVAGEIFIDKGSSQALWSAGSENRNLTVNDGSVLTLIGELPTVEPRANVTLMRYATYGDVVVNPVDSAAGTKASALRIAALEWNLGEAACTSVHVKSLTLGEDSTTELLFNFLGAEKEDLAGTKTGAAIAPIIEADGDITIKRGAHIAMNSLGSSFGLQDGQDIVDMVVMRAGSISGSYMDGDSLDLVMGGIFLVFYNNDASLKVRGNEIVFNAKMRNENVFNPAALDASSRAGADLLWAARYSGSLSFTAFDEESHMYRLMETAAILAQSGSTQQASRILAGAAGSTVPALGTAQRDALRAQMLRMRDHTGTYSLKPEYAYEEMPYFHAWVEGTGHFSELDGDGTLSGYRLNAWGGSVGADMDISENASIGLGVTALYGDLSAGEADKGDGKLDSYYLTFMGRFRTTRWAHTVVATVGLNEAKLDRTVNYGAGSYNTQGSTSGWGGGIMYEAAYNIELNPEGTSTLAPLFAASLVRTSLKGYEETGEKELGLNVGKQEWTTFSVSLGARWTTEMGENVFGRTALFELQAAVAQDLGDSQGETDVALQVNPTVSRKVKAAEVGKTALQLGVGLHAPVNENSQLYLNGSAELRAGMTSWNVTVGYKFSF